MCIVRNAFSTENTSLTPLGLHRNSTKSQKSLENRIYRASLRVNLASRTFHGVGVVVPAEAEEAMAGLGEPTVLATLAEKPWGVTFEVGAQKRLFVADVASNGNAERAGLRQGMVLAAVNGKTAFDAKTALKLLKRKPPIELALCEAPISTAGRSAGPGLAKFKAAGTDVMAKLRAQEAEILAELAAIDAKKKKKPGRTAKKFSFADAGKAVVESLRAQEAAIVAELKLLGMSEDEIDRIGPSKGAASSTRSTNPAQPAVVQVNPEGQHAAPGGQASAEEQQAAAKREARQRKMAAENWAVGPRPGHPSWTSRRWCLVRNSYIASKPRDLTIGKGDLVRLSWGEPKKWWCGENITAGPAGQVGEFPNNYVQVLRKAISRREYPLTETQQSAAGGAATPFDAEKDLRLRKGDILVLTDSRPTKRWWTGFVLDPRWESAWGISSRAGLEPPEPRTFPADFVTLEPADEPFEITATFVPLQGKSASAGGSVTLTVNSTDTVDELIEKLITARSDVVGSVASMWPEGWEQRFTVVVGTPSVQHH